MDGQERLKRLWHAGLDTLSSVRPQQRLRVSTGAWMRCALMSNATVSRRRQAGP